MYIKLNFQIFILLAIFLLTSQVEIYAATMLFIGIHELAHILAGIALGYKIRRLKILPFGFNVTFEKYTSKNTFKSKIERIIVAMAGPAINVMIACVWIFIDIGISYVSRETVIYSNLLLAIINLIPISPLDGGRILKELLAIKLDKVKTIKLISKITYVSIIFLTILSSIAILYYQNIGIFLAILFLWIISIKELKANKCKIRIYEIILKDRENRKVKEAKKGAKRGAKRDGANWPVFLLN